MFMTRYTRPDLPLESGGGESLVESAGYIPAQRQIEQFMTAGRRLALARKEMFDFPDGVEREDFTDPTRSPNFDLADAVELGAPAVHRLDAATEEYKKLQKDKKLQEKKEYEEYKKARDLAEKEPKT